jgi:hypothetical protein
MTGARAKGVNHGGRGLITDLTGQSFGKLAVLRRLDISEVRALGTRSTSAHWLCRCACGAEKPVVGRSLHTGASRSCGSKTCREVRS